MALADHQVGEAQQKRDPLPVLRQPPVAHLGVAEALLGRGIGHAVGILMSGDEDDDIHEYFRRSAFPREDWVSAALEVLDESDGLSIVQLEEEVNLRRGQIEKVLKFLSVDNPAPVIKSGVKWQRTPVPYRMDIQQIGRLTGQRETEWREVQEYIDEEGCLMEFLAKALDDTDSQPCGKCAPCLDRPVVEPFFARETVIIAARFLRQSELALNCNKRVVKDAFPEYGFQGTLPGVLHAEMGRILSRWGDAGWGQLVADDKHAGRFRDELVDAVLDMLKNRWQPSPPPEWVTCVPSRNHPASVPDYAGRLAEVLGLPFRPVARKIRNNDPQKVQQNTFHQCRNLDGAFAIEGFVPEGPVLLVDDVVDSGWTLTVLAALLRRAGSGPVWPLALTTSKMGA